MKLYKIILILIIISYQQTLSIEISDEFSDTVLSKSGFQLLSARNKVIALNDEANKRLDRLNIEGVIDYLRYAEEISRRLNNSDLIYKTYLNYGYYFKLKKEYEPSANYYYKALQIANNNTKQKIEVLIGLGETYRASNAYYVGIKILNQTLNIIAKADDDSYKSDKARIYNRIASIYYELIYTPYEGNKKETSRKVIRYIDSSLQNTSETDYFLLISNYNVKGVAYKYLKDLKNSYFCLNKALSIMRLYPDSAFTYYHYHNVMLNYATLYYSFAKYKEAESIALEALRYYKDKKVKVNEDLLYIVLSDIYEKLNDYKNAYKYKKLGYDYYVNDRYVIQQRTLLDIDAKYNFQRQEAAIQQQQEVLFYQSIGIILALGLLIVIVFVNRSRHKALSEINRLTNLQNNELQQINDSKDKFFSIIAHDLKNPVFSVNSFLNYMVQDYDKIDKSELKSNLEMLVKHTNNLAQLLDNLLTWARVKSGKMTIEPAKLRISDIIRNAIEIAEIQAEDKSIKLNYEEGINDSTLVFADSNSLITVFRNILSNAIKFTPDNGIISIAADKDEKYVIISIVDSGVGIPEDKLTTLFATERNYQSNGTNQELGTGLGLILCREFVEKNGGTIWAQSEIGVGSTFYFTIPRVS